MTCGIYCITSPSGKKYVGQSVNIERRWQDHRSYPKQTPRLIDSFAEHGIASHAFEILQECQENELLLYEREWQLKLAGELNVLLTTGKEKFGKASEATRQKMSAAQSGENNPNYGKRGADTSTFGRKRTEAERKAISAFQQTRGRLICQIDKITGQLITKAKVRDFVKQGFSQGNISSCCNGRLQSHKGYKFQYEASV